MNAERILEFLTAILSVEQELRLQKRLNGFHSALASLASQPQPQQQAVANTFKELSAAIIAAEDRLTPAQWSFLGEICAIDYFSQYGLDEIDANIKANSMTPVVVADFVGKFTSKRSEALEKFTQLKLNLEFIGLKVANLQPGEAELGFHIPRPIFNNQLRDFSVELKVIDRIVGFVSEAVLGRREIVEVRQLSSSDPTVFIQTAAPVVLAVGATITWLLDCLERTMRIRKLRQEAKETGHPDEGLKIFDRQINDLITKETEKRIEELVGTSSKIKTDGRRNEIEIGLRWAIDSLFARIERGMTVELRFIPPSKPEAGPDSEASDGNSDDRLFSKLADIRQALSFPNSSGEPIRELPPPEPPKKTPDKGAANNKS